MYLKSIIFLLFGVIAFYATNSCSLVGSEAHPLKAVDLRVNHFLQTGFGESLHLVYLTQEEEEIGSTNWSYFYEEIEGFDYESGYIYDLKVKKIEIENPPMDGSSIKYILLNVRSKEKVPANMSFSIDLKKDGTSFVTEGGDGLFLLNQYKIDCGTMCENLMVELETKDFVSGTFVHGPSQSLVLQTIN